MGVDINVLVAEPTGETPPARLVEGLKAYFVEGHVDGITEVYDAAVDDGRAILKMQGNAPGTPVEPFREVVGVERAAWLNVSDNDYCWATYFERVGDRVREVDRPIHRVSFLGLDLLDYFTREYGFDPVYDVNGTYVRREDGP